MEQTFYKSLQGHKLEFNRLLYPVSYHISTKDVENESGSFMVHKNEEGAWTLMQPEDLPEWINSLSYQIQEVILENEVGVY